MCEPLRRAPAIQRLLNGLKNRSGMGDATAKTLLEASEHPYQCRCEQCLDWWSMVGPEEAPDGRRSWGPFTETEIMRHRSGKEA